RAPLALEGRAVLGVRPRERKAAGQALGRRLEALLRLDAALDRLALAIAAEVGGAILGAPAPLQALARERVVRRRPIGLEPAAHAAAQVLEAVALLVRAQALDALARGAAAGDTAARQMRPHRARGAAAAESAAGGSEPAPRRSETAGRRSGSGGERRAGDHGQRERPPGRHERSSKRTPVSSSETAHRRAAVLSSRARRLAP